MNPRRFLILSIISLFGIAACESNEIEKPTPTQASVSITSPDKNPTIAQEGGEISVKFTTNSEWTAEIVCSATQTDSWARVSPAKGAAGNNSITVSIEPNEYYDERNATLTIKAGNASGKLTISQKQKDALTVSSNKIEIGAEGGESIIEIMANVDYEYAIDADSESWLSVTTTKALQSSDIILQIAANEDFQKREGSVTIFSGNLQETVNIYQDAREKEEASLILSQNEYSVGSSGETIKVELKSNVDYTVQLPDCDWIDEAKTRATSGHTHYFDIAANETHDSRSASIYFINEENGIQESVNITQAQKDAIIIAQHEYVVEAEGGTLDFTVSSNVDFTVNISADWIAQTNTKALQDSELHFSIAENPSTEMREASIMLSDGELNQTVLVTQKAKQKETTVEEIDGVTVVNMAEAGALPAALGEKALEITSIKIIGEINGTDIECLRQMLNGTRREYGDPVYYDNPGVLENLDMAEATIVEGGNAYTFCFYDCYTENNVIGDYMFRYCNNLKTIILPENLITIKASAFSYCNALENIDIPAQVTKIESSAFYECSSLKTAKMSDSVIEAGSYLFYKCQSLSDVRLSSNLKAIEERTFNNCSSLQDMEIPASVTKIGSYAFSNCTALGEITLQDGLKEILDHAFVNCSSLTSITVPETVHTLDGEAFSGCSTLSNVEILGNISTWGVRVFKDLASITDLVLEDGITTIGEGAFQNCTGLTSVIIPDSVTNIGDYAFQDCINIKNLKLSDNLESIGTYAFNGCNSFESLTVPASIESWGMGVFINCDMLSQLTLSEGLKSLGESAFHACDALVSVDIPESITAISEKAFWMCLQLKEVNLPETLQSIGSSAFELCRLEQIDVPANVKEIGGSAFYGNWTLAKVTLHEGLETIGTTAFASCGFTAIDLPNSLTSIGQQAFHGSGLETISIPDGVTVIKYQTFGYCRNLRSVNLPEGLSDLEEQAFVECEVLDNVVLPGTITNFGKQVFWNCKGLKTVSISEGITYIGQRAFESCDSLARVILPNSVKEIREGAFRGCSQLFSVTLPEGLEIIGDSVFEYCTTLTHLTLPGTTKSLGKLLFNKCDKISTLYCYAPTPPAIVEKTFNYKPVVYVPGEYVDAYKASDWGLYLDYIRAVEYIL